MPVILSLILAACALGAGAGLLAVLGLWLWLFFTLLDALVRQVPRGALLFLRLVTWPIVWSFKAGRYMWVHERKRSLRLAQCAHIWLFVWWVWLQDRYVSGELRRLRAM